MDVKKTIEIDLAKYGVDGVIELRTPTFRKINELRNARSRYAKIRISRKNTDEGTITGDAEGDMDILGHMAYVIKAPFKTTIEGFLAFTDMLDEKEIGYGLALWTELRDAVQEIDDQETSSPFVSSPEAENATSD